MPDAEQFADDSTALGLSLLTAANAAAPGDHKLVGAAIGDLIREYLHENPNEFIGFHRYISSLMAVVSLELATGIKA